MCAGIGGRTSECKVGMACVRGRLAAVLQKQVKAHTAARIDRHMVGPLTLIWRSMAVTAFTSALPLMNAA